MRQITRLTAKQQREYLDAVIHGERQIWKNKYNEIRVYYYHNDILHAINPLWNTTYSDLERKGFHKVNNN